MLLIYLSCAWVVGILLGAIFSPPLFLFLVGLLPLPLVFVFRQYRKPIITISLCLLALLGGAFRFQSSLPVVNEDVLQFYNDQGIAEIKGTIDKDVEARDKATYLHLSAKEIKWGEEWHPVSGDALVLVPRYPKYSYGDVLEIKGKLETPPRLGDFDYREYLARQQIYSISYYPEIQVLEHGEGSRPLTWVYAIRSNLSQTLARVLPEPQAALAQGMVLGIRSNIPDSLKEDFTNSGTAHILAISGVNISIVAGLLISLGIWLFGKRGYIYIWLALGTVWLYALLTGLQPPVIRAAIMATMFLAAELFGRQRSAAVAFCFAAAIMVGVTPQVLGEAAFQLSFMAMAGLIFVFPLIQTLGRRIVSDKLGESGVVVSSANFVVDSFGVSLAAMIAVWPLIAHYFGIISWVGPLATFVALPALAGITVTVIMAGGLGLILLPLGQVVAWIAWLLLSYLVLVVHVFAIIPPLPGGALEASWVWFYYAVLALMIWASNNRKRVVDIISRIGDGIMGLPKKSVLVALAVVAILVWLTVFSLPDNKLHVVFLDVGQGDAILIQKGNKQVLVDGGPSPQAISSELGQEMPFWDRTVEVVVSTHPHADHITGLIEVLKRYKVEKVVYPGLSYKSADYDEWLRLIAQKKIEYTFGEVGQQIKMGEVTIDILNPQTNQLTGTQSDIDNNTMVLRVSDGQVSFLLTADMMREAELELVSQRAVSPTTILKVAHHGSSTSTSAEFLAVAQPQIAVISVGQNNAFGHPNQDVVGRLQQEVGQANIYRTDENGTIEFITDGERVWVRSEK